MVDDLTERAQSARNKLEDLMAKIPGVVMEKQPKLISADRRTIASIAGAL